MRRGSPSLDYRRHRRHSLEYNLIAQIRRVRTAEPVPVNTHLGASSEEPFQKLDGLQDERVDLLLGVTGDNPVLLVRLAP